MDTTIGAVRFQLWQVKCRNCNRIFAPLLALLGLVWVRRTDRFTIDLASGGHPHVVWPDRGDSHPG